jgi:hypothetical protein
MRPVVERDTARDGWAIDELLERYVYWREECCAVRQAYQRWTDSERGERRLTYGGYLAALDREESAAGAYADQIERVGVICTAR